MKADILADACRALADGHPTTARDIAHAEYPFVPIIKAQRRYTERHMMKVFVRDGFIDRYSGDRLVFPGTLRLLSQLMPDEFPVQKNWKMSETHQAWWELCPTIDHVVPVARGGADDETNWATTSMLRNSAKANWTLDELGWTLREPGSMGEWDGLTAWFVEYVGKHPGMAGSGYLKRWKSAARASVRKG